MNTILLALCAPSLAATVTVAPDGDFTSLDEAVHESANGDTIQVLASDDELVVIDGRELIIQGMGPDAAVGALQFLGASSVTVSGITVRQGVEVEGGQITLDAMRFEGRGKMTGPALTVRDGTVSAVGITVSDWEMEDGSPVQVFGGDVEVESGSFLRTAGSQGGAMRLEAGLLSVSSSSFEDNRAEGAGGAISATGGHLRVESSSFLSGQAAQGGHISVHGTTATISRSTFEAGEATEGGGLLSFEAAQVTLLGSYMAGGAAGRGGSVYIDGGEADLQDTHSVGSVATDGGHIYASDAQVRVTRSVIESGSATRGGGFFQDGGDVTVQNAVWTGIEWAEVGGAWFQNAGTSRVAFATIGDNRAAAGAGMAVMGGSSAVEGSIISGNHGSEGLYARGAGEMQLSTSLLYGNAGYETIGNITLQAGSMVGDPMIKAPEAGEWMPGSYSPALDSGPPGQLDPDGSPADMGAYGGPFAWRLQDHDQDGYPYGRDCDDEAASVHEYAEDLFYDGVDSDCRANDDYDQDGDGHQAAQYGGDDCDDTDASRSPSLDERNGDATDSDCDGLLDQDLDGDGWSANVDCDDQDASVHPWADDEPYDSVDADCAGDDDWDADGDGWRVGADCDDTDASVAPDAAEIGDDGIDQDCDGEDLSLDDGASEDADGAREIITPDPDFPASQPDRTLVTVGCSTSPTSSGFAAALMALAGSLLLRRRD
jgi:uncharacterized protein (TIGR03382 family)